MLLFFDDILIYSPCCEFHLTHLHRVLQTMRDNALYAKLSKCHLAIPKVEYLGHYISSHGVETYPKKIETMLQWPQPKNQKELRSFLGLTGYYRRFIKGHAHVCRPLTDLLRKDGFIWNAATIVAIQDLMTAMTTTPVLALSGFSLPFEV